MREMRPYYLIFNPHTGALVEAYGSYTVPMLFIDRWKAVDALKRMQGNNTRYNYEVREVELVVKSQ